MNIHVNVLLVGCMAGRVLCTGSSLNSWTSPILHPLNFTIKDIVFPNHSRMAFLRICLPKSGVALE